MQPECIRSMIQLMEGGSNDLAYRYRMDDRLCSLQATNNGKGLRRTEISVPRSRLQNQHRPSFRSQPACGPVGNWTTGSLSIESIQLLANSLPWTETKLARKQATTN